MAAHLTSVDTLREGLYLVWRCDHPACAVQGGEKYAFLGCDGVYDLLKTTVICGWCRMNKGQVVRVLLRKCRWSYRGELCNGESKFVAENATPGDVDLSDMNAETWRSVHMTITPLCIIPPIKRRRSSDSCDFTSQSAAPVAEAHLSIEEAREDLKRKQEIVDILKSEMKVKEKEKQGLIERIQKMREEVEILKRRA